MSRLLGLDYGSKRVGVAISDGIRLTARPLEVVDRPNIVKRIAELMTEYDVDKVVVGMPNSLGGHDGESAKGARSLVSEIENELGLEVEVIDERFTSRMAEEALLESGMKRRERRSTVDKVAAAIILQSYLDGQRSGNSDEA